MAAEISKPNFNFQWASGGAVVAPSDVKIQTGWTAEVPPFQWENFLQNRQDNAILHVFQKGISEWDALSNYYFTASGVRSYVQGSNGTIYVAVQDNINQNPVTDTSHTYWDEAFSVKGAIRRVKRVIFSASGTYTPSAGMVFCEVELIAGGGGGGGALGGSGTSAAGGGGGAGGYAKKIFSAADIGVSKVVTIGVAGTAGVAGNNAGGTGGNSSFGALLTCNGGGGGGGSGAIAAAAVAAAGGVGGTTTGGEISIRGGNGSPSFILSAANGGLSGAGSPSILGTAGTPTGPQGSGNPAFGNGSGGSGGATNTVTSATGAAGTAGGCWITEYCTI